MDISATGGDPERASAIVVDAPEVDLSRGIVVLVGGFVDAARSAPQASGSPAPARGSAVSGSATDARARTCGVAVGLRPTYD